jgi:Skp family chaperone for outer membrane proteins
MKLRKELQMNSYLKVLMGSMLCLILPLIIAIPTYSADLKLAKVSWENIVNNSARAKAATEDIKKMQMESNTKLSAMRTEINQLEEKLKDEKSPLKKEEKDKIESELQRKIEEMTNEQQTLQAKLTFKERTLQNVFRTQIKLAVEKVAKEEGVTAVFSEQAMIFSGSLPDLTDKVIKEFDAMPALEKQPQQ